MKQIKRIRNLDLTIQIAIGLVIGIILGTLASTLGGTFASITSPLSIFGILFVSALKSVAPIVVFFLVIKALSSQKEGSQSNMGRVLFIYLIATFSAALVAVFVSFTMPVELIIPTNGQDIVAPSSLMEVLSGVFFNIIVNPVTALSEANYLGILFWAVLIGIALRSANQTSKTFIADIADAITKIVEWIISLAPFGIMGLVYSSIAENGLSALSTYMDLIIVLLIAMGIQAFIVNPLIVYMHLRENPYPLVLKCYSKSGITAFFTRSSAANIPVNIELCNQEGVNPQTSDVSIPLGATINMGGAAITINVITLAAANTLGIEVTIPMAILLSVISAISACGASGVAGGSLLLIPLACSLIGIPNDIAAQVVAIGYTISVVQDSVETAINSSSDAIFTIVADRYYKRKNS